MHVLDLGALEAAARERLDRGVYDFVAGAADDELTMAANVGAWDSVFLRPRVLRDVTNVDTSTTLLGTAIGSPIGIAPVAYQRLLHPDGECAMSRAAAARHSMMVLSTRATASPADCFDAAPDGPRWYQVYVLNDRSRNERLIEIAVTSGISALVLTADTPVLGRRRRDLANRFVHPGEAGGPSLELKPGEEGHLVDQAADVTFDDISWLHELSGLPVVVKGVVRGDDAQACVEAGAAAVWVSNHGGRQLDGCLPTAAALPEVVKAVGEVAEVYVDGGIRRGTDVLRALAMGADAAFVGRPAAWGLAVEGSVGVELVLKGLKGELELAMALAGARSIDDITADLIAP
ncbi:MAG TPA: alpha-hydroxy acid oxidase [Acidimicrobiales bacterium]|nr:alpha-hydroxy acid oxidase [Acidimicrobiales bacterium]